MPRHIALTIYSAVFGVAMLAGLMIATALRPTSLSISGFAISTPTPAPAIPTATTVRATALGLGQVAAQMVSAARPTQRAAAAAPASTATSLPATATHMPTTPTETPTPSATETPAAQPNASQPLAFSALIFDKPTDAAVACGTSFESRIWGVVKNQSGRGIGRAVVQVSSNDGRNRYRATTNSQGGFEIPGLGCTAWIVRLVSVPGAPAGIDAAALRVGVNGGRYTGAGIEFRQR
jgi:hypothetical protein